MKTINIRYFINVNMRNQMFTLIFFVILLFLVFINSRVSLYNVFFGHFNFDAVSSFNDENTCELVLTDADESGDYAVITGSTFYSYRQNFRPNFQKVMGKFKQGIKYNFMIKPIDVIYLKKDGTSLKFMANGSEKKTKVKPDFLLLDTGSCLILSKKTNGLKNMKFKGKLLPITPAFIDETDKIGVPKSLKAGKIFIYELADDAFTTSNEIFDIVLFFAVLFIVAYNAIKLTIYIRDYKQHPAYKSLSKLYGNPEQNASDIDQNLALHDQISVYKNKYNTPKWVIEKKFFKTKFSPVHKDY